MYEAPFAVAPTSLDQPISSEVILLLSASCSSDEQVYFSERGPLRRITSRSDIFEEDSSTLSSDAERNLDDVDVMIDQPVRRIEVDE